MSRRKKPNTSAAVMAQRHEPADSLDDFPTPPWATRALMEHVIKPHMSLIEDYARQTVWEPTCNRGYMTVPLSEYFGQVIASDIHDYGLAGTRLYDFTRPQFNDPVDERVDWIMFNPPFRLAEEFIAEAFRQAPEIGVAVYARLQLIEGVERWRNVYSKHRNFLFAPFVERCSLVKGTVDPTASLPTAYAWFVFFQPTRAKGARPLTHIPPCRAGLERAGDYWQFDAEQAAAPLLDAISESEAGP